MDSETIESRITDHQYAEEPRSLRLRLFRPAGTGPFPVVVNLHGGAWTKGDLEEYRPRDEAIAAAGIASAALDFRHAGDGYPTSLVDINFAVRWLKHHAASLDLDPARVGLAGQSSGARQRPALHRDHQPGALSERPLRIPAGHRQRAQRPDDRRGRGRPRRGRRGHRHFERVADRRARRDPRCLVAGETNQARYFQTRKPESLGTRALLVSGTP